MQAAHNMQQQLLRLPQVQFNTIHMPWPSVQAASGQHHGSTAGSSMALVWLFYSCQLWELYGSSMAVV